MDYLIVTIYEHLENNNSSYQKRPTVVGKKRALNQDNTKFGS